MESMIHLILALAIFGFVVWIVLQILMPGIVRNIILGLISIFVVIWVLQIFGVETGFKDLRIR